jgi:hypothetical protein
LAVSLHAETSLHLQLVWLVAAMHLHDHYTTTAQVIYELKLLNNGRLLSLDCKLLSAVYAQMPAALKLREEHSCGIGQAST